MRALNQQTILITGATDGLGRALATALAADGATVLIHGRDEDRASETLEAIAAETGSEKLRYLLADLSSLEQVRELARRVVEEHDQLDVLVNNAGIGTTLPGDGRRMESQDGYELRFAVNYLAGYLLTRTLLGLLERSAPARVVNVSSAGQAPIDFTDVMLERRYDGVQAYCQSKLAQIMFTFDLEQELAGRNVAVNCLHPATFMDTTMVRMSGVQPISTVEDGGAAILQLVEQPSLEGRSGLYFNGMRESRADPQAYDAAARRKLRALSFELVAVADPVEPRV